MQLKNIFTTALCAGIVSFGLDTVKAQTLDSWVGPATGGEWNTGANWSATTPPTDSTVNAYILSGTNVNYNLPMTATSFGALTNRGILNINASGFNNAAIIMTNINSRLFVNAGGVLNVTGDFELSSNAASSMAPGTSVTLGRLIIGGDDAGGTASSIHAFGSFTNFGGTLSAGSTLLNPGNGSINTSCRLVISGGINNLGTLTDNRSPGGAGAPPALGTDGVVISNGVVNTTSISIGNNAHGVMYLVGGAVTNANTLTLKNITLTRPARFVQAGGLFVDAGLSVVATTGTADTVYTVLGGTNIVGGFVFNAATNYFTNAANIYVGSQGIVASNAVLQVFASLNGGGLFGASAPWSSAVGMKLASGLFTFQTADLNNTPQNISLTGVLSGNGGMNVTGGGVLTLGGANTYAGNTVISAGSLVMTTGSSLASAQVIVGSGTTFDVSQVTSFTLNANQTLSGFGTVAGAVTASSGSTIYPGSNSITGTINFSSALTENGGVINQFNLSSNPSGPGNDFINTPNGLVLSGTNTVIIVGSLTSGSAYPLIKYGSSLTGDITNLMVSGPTGVFSNSAANQTIYFIPQTSIRTATNIVWIGNPTANNWDTESTTNWLNTGTGALDYFVPGDTAFFNNLGTTNPLVNIAASVAPAQIIVNTTSNYTFAGNGAVAGIGGLTISNGTLVVLTTNTYTGATILAGGVLVTPNIGNSAQPSGLGAASSDPANVVFNGGVLNFEGLSASTDHGMLFTNAGGTFDVTNGSTLTLNGALTGNGGLTLVDSGTLTLNGVNNYTGVTTVSNGTLSVVNALALGTGSVNLNGGVLALGAVKPANTIVANGGSVRGGNTGGLTGIAQVTGSGNLVISVTTSNGTFDLTGDMSTFSGTVTLSNANTGSSFVRFNGSTGSALATWDLGTGPMDLNVRTSSATNSIGALKGGANTTLSGRGGSSNNGPSTWFIGGNNLSTTYSGDITNGSGGSSSTGAINKVGTGTLSLSGQNAYTGPTTITTGTLALINNGTTDGSINGSSVINILPGAILDVSGRSDDTLQLGNNGANQILEGRGNLNGLLNVGGQGTVAPGGGLGGSPGVLTVNNAVTLNGTAWMKVNRTNSLTSDELVSPSTIAYGGTLVVTNVGPTLQVGDTFTLFHGSSMSGGFNFVFPIYTAWDTSQLNAHGTVTLTRIFKPIISQEDFSGLGVDGSVTISVTNGVPLGNINILTSTNLALPLSQWTTNTSGGFDINGNMLNFTFQVDNTLPQQFIIIQGF